jgi:hypothetical protein
LEKDCASRYQTAAEMRDELQQLVHEAYLRLIDQTRRYSTPRSASPLAADDGLHPAVGSYLDPGARRKLISRCVRVANFTFQKRTGNYRF